MTNRLTLLLHCNEEPLFEDDEPLTDDDIILMVNQ